MSILNAAIICLALNIYHEARGEPLPGQYAVALVTLNRAKISGEKICSVVYEKAQFSWTLDKPKVKDKRAFLIAKTIAKTTLTSKVPDITSGATHYHATYVRPKWTNNKKPIIKIGKHKFYKRIPGKYSK